VFLENVTVSQLFKKCHVVFRAQSFNITMFTRAQANVLYIISSHAIFWAPLTQKTGGNSLISCPWLLIQYIHLPFIPSGHLHPLPDHTMMNQRGQYACTYTHTYIPWLHKCVIKTIRCEQVINTQIYKFTG